MASDPFAEADQRPLPTAEDHLSMCADFTLIERIRKDLKVVYRCAECDYRFTEDHPDIEALTYDAFRYTVPIVHPSKYRPGV
jgi:hypothetical protein